MALNPSSGSELAAAVCTNCCAKRKAGAKFCAYCGSAFEDPRVTIKSSATPPPRPPRQASSNATPSPLSQAQRALAEPQKNSVIHKGNTAYNETYSTFPEKRTRSTRRTSDPTSDRMKPLRFPGTESIESVSATSTEIIKCGILHKQGHIRKNWLRRWFELRGNELFYFDIARTQRPKGSIPLAGCTAEPIEVAGRTNCFVIRPSEERRANKKTFLIQAENESLRAEWIAAVNAAAN